MNMISYVSLFSLPFAFRSSALSPKAFPPSKLRHSLSRLRLRLRAQLHCLFLKLPFSLQKELHFILADRSGIGTIELVLILVVLIALVAIFKTQITSLLNNIFEEINSAAGEIY